MSTSPIFLHKPDARMSVHARMMDMGCWIIPNGGLQSALLLMKHGWVIQGYTKGEKVSTPEGKIKTKLNIKLRKLNHLWKFMPVPSGYGLPSLDYLLCIGGHFVAIEAKADAKKQPTPRQIQTMAEIRAAGGLVFVVYDNETIDACIGSLVLLSGAPRDPS